MIVAMLLAVLGGAGAGHSEVVIRYTSDFVQFAELRVDASGEVALIRRERGPAILAQAPPAVVRAYLDDARSHDMLQGFEAVAKAYPPQGPHCPVITVSVSGETFRFAPYVAAPLDAEGRGGLLIWEMVFQEVAEFFYRTDELSSAWFGERYGNDMAVLETQRSRLFEFRCGNE